MNISSSQPLLNVELLSKKFGDFVANDKINLSLQAGSIHALLGENGAGKSTLVKMIYGALQPTSGVISWQGERVRIDNPAKARSMGIGMVFQHFSLFEALSVSENISLALPKSLRDKNLSQRIENLSHAYGLPLQANALVADLSVGERQRIEIVRCLLQTPKLLIMDEPTSVLTPQEADALFVTLNRLTDEGCAVLYISHRLQEVQNLCHEVTILRHGQVVKQLNPKTETAATLASYMVGEQLHNVTHNTTKQVGEPLLQLQHFSLGTDAPFGIPLQNLNLTVKAGEIVAVAGIAGNGQGELFDALSGEICAPNTQASRQNQHIYINGQAVDCLGINSRRKLGAAFVPEERNGHGAVGNFNLPDNVLLSRHSADADMTLQRSFIGINKTQVQEINQRVIDTYDIRNAGLKGLAGALSGGNLQKFMVGRELDREPSLLVINQPTWGVDAGAAILIHQALLDLAAKGSAILMISQDLDEISTLADKVAVMFDGQLSPLYSAQTLSREKIGLLMAGESNIDASTDASVDEVNLHKQSAIQGEN